MPELPAGLLDTYRVLDLTDEKGQFSGKLMGDMGAEVIKIEAPGGDDSRDIGPFVNDDKDRNKSLYWFANNTSKRGVTLDIGSEQGKDLFLRLVKQSDFVLESFAPGYLESLGLGYEDLEKVNPRIILVSITPFGQTGPYRDFKGPDIVMWALGAGPNMRSFDSHDRAPYRISHHPQTYFHAGTEAVVGAMVAAFHCGTTGEGQHVDVSIQECVSWHPAGDWDFNRRLPVRGTAASPLKSTHIWPCKDGYVMWRYAGGPGATRQSIPLVEWMTEEDMTDEWLQNFDWSRFNPFGTTQDIIDRIEEQTINFFMNHTKAELMAGGIRLRIMLYPVSTAADLYQCPQLEARDFWEEVEHPELGMSITYPGKWAVNSECSPRISRRAPLIGEHNEEVYLTDLGLSEEALGQLIQKGVI